jgi:putative endonuclease
MLVALPLKDTTMNQNKNTGSTGEDLAVEFLTKKGYTILHRNWRFRYWEVDIIASKGKFLHFIEIKTRTNTRYGLPEESISQHKMNNLKNAAEEYQYQHPEWKFIQFDVLAILMQQWNEPEYFLIEDVYF